MDDDKGGSTALSKVLTLSIVAGVVALLYGFVDSFGGAADDAERTSAEPPESRPTQASSPVVVKAPPPRPTSAPPDPASGSPGLSEGHSPPQEEASAPAPTAESVADHSERTAQGDSDPIRRAHDALGQVQNVLGQLEFSSRITSQESGQRANRVRVCQKVARALLAAKVAVEALSGARTSSGQPFDESILLEAQTAVGDASLALSQACADAERAIKGKYYSTISSSIGKARDALNRLTTPRQVGVAGDRGVGGDLEALRSASEADIAKIRSAAEQGDREAQWKLGALLEEGKAKNRRVRSDDAQAAEWYRKAAEQGLPMAQYDLGFLLSEGRGVTKDQAEAIEWFRKAADQGLPVAQLGVGIAYAQGIGVSQDDTEAVRWLRAAADNGLWSAQHNLACRYREGKGVEKDASQAIEWFKKSATQGNWRSAEALGDIYASGDGVPEDKEEAIRWFQMSADKGSPSAQRRLRSLQH